MNILHLQKEINLACGVTKTIYLIVKNTDKSYRHHIICLGGDGLIRFERIGFFLIVIHYNRFSVSGAIKIFFYLLKFCKKNKIDIIHSHHRYFDFLSSIVGKYLKIKTVMSVQSKVYGLRFFSYKSDLLIACGETIKKHLINYFKINPRRIKVIHNFVDLDEVNINIPNSDLRNKLGICTDSFALGFFGRLNKREKGLDLLLESFKILIKRYEKLHLILVGDGEDKRYVENFINNNNLKIKLVSSSENIFDYYNLCNIIVLPSRIDPFPLVLLEAGLMKKPFIGSNVDGISEVIENNENGILVRPENVNELVEAISFLIENESKAKELGENLYKKITSEFTADIIIPQYEALYSELLNEKN